LITALAAAAASWGVVMSLSPTLQIRVMLKHRTSHGVSIAYPAVLIVGFMLWLAYGVALHNYALIVPNCMSILVSGAAIAVAAHYRRRPGRENVDPSSPRV
jgi:MtN3 and saliva related transmembrane protein